MENLSEIPESEDDFNSMMLVNIVRELGIKNFTFSTALSIDAPETIAGFNNLKLIVRAAYKLGIRDTIALN